MRQLYWILLGTIGVAAVVVSVRLDPAARARGQPPVGPPAVLQAMEAGRFLAATRMLRQDLAARRDTSAETVLLLARAEAGWGHWPAVEALLADRPWLDRVERGAGLELLGRARLARRAWKDAAADLGHYLALAGEIDDRQRGLALVRQAQALRRAGDEAAALRAYYEGASRLGSAGDWVRLEAVGAAADAGDTARVRLGLGDLPAVLTRIDAWRLRLRAATQAHDTAAALAAVQEAEHALPGAGARAEALVAEGNLRLRLHDQAGARAAFNRALRLDPGSAAAARALLTLSGLSPDEERAAALALLDAGEAAHAAAPLRAYLARARVAPGRRAALLLDLGRGLFFSGRYAEAIDALRAALAGADPGTASQALYLTGRAQVRLGRTRDARVSLLRVVEVYPSRSAAASALFLLGDLAQDAGSTQAARAYFGQVVARRTPASTVGEAYMRLGAMAYAAHDYAGAAALYEAYRRRQPGGDYAAQATYWAGRSYLSLGRSKLARARLDELVRAGSVSYYAVKAARLLGRAPLAPALAGTPPPAGAARDEAVAGADAVATLRDLGLDEAADAQTRALEARFAGNDPALYDLAEALNARGSTSAGIRIGYGLRGRAAAWNIRLLRIVYPFPHQADVVAAARARDLDPYLVAGLIHQESSFNARARSRVGAIGLMQLMPGTGHTLGRALDLPTAQAGVLENPEVNVQLGTAFVANLMRQTHGSVPQMLAAFNAGPARLDAWRRFPEARDPELFAERIPFDETRDYVKVVQANADIYHALYPGLGATAGMGA